jgi:GNAT superfamily N-acetyltransferase
VGDVDPIRIELVNFWDVEQIVELYRSEGWWKDFMDKSRIPELIRGSYLFALAIDTSNSKPIGMGRVISDGIADAYIQDLVVLPEWRNKNAGGMIVSALIEQCVSNGISWIGLIAQPGTDSFYRSLGFEPMAGHVPMLYHGGREDAGSN